MFCTLILIFPFLCQNGFTWPSLHLVVWLTHERIWFYNHSCIIFSLFLLPLAAMCKLSHNSLNLLCLLQFFVKETRVSWEAEAPLWQPPQYYLVKNTVQTPIFFFSAFLVTLELLCLNIELPEDLSDGCSLDGWKSEMFLLDNIKIAGESWKRCHSTDPGERVHSKVKR